MPKLRIHIGHHFFGAGNLGDDLMLAGFLEAARPRWLESVILTCCTPHPRDRLRRRFPEVGWLPYDDGERAARIERADVWLGLGDTPFQATGGRTWFLDHLCQEAAWCRQYGTPMFYLGVGVNERAVLDYPQVRALVDGAERLWMRDETSAAMLRPLAAPGKVTAHSDLAHLALAGMRFPPPEPGTLGLVLNFENFTQFNLERLSGLVDAAAGASQLRWLAQEIRPLPGSETVLHGRLPAGCRGKAPLVLPDYAGAGSVRALLPGWDGLESLFVSRYHAMLVGAWADARVSVFARNDKVAGAARQLGLPEVADLDDVAAILHAVQSAQRVPRRVLLDLAAQVNEVCEEFFGMAAPPSSKPVRSSTDIRAAGPPRRLLFVRPDAYGDLCLFEPVLRILRDAWPQTELAVLIRESHRDIVPLFGNGSVRWLTTNCDPYREGPGDPGDPGNPGEYSAKLDALRDTVRGFAPDCVVAACAAQTWLEAAVAAFLPGTRQISLGQGGHGGQESVDPIMRTALEAVIPVEWAEIYPEKVPLDPHRSEWEQNLGLASALLGHEAPAYWPVVTVPDPARLQAEQIASDAGLSPGRFAVCAAAGTANVPIKSWPAERYGETLAWLEKERGIRTLLIGHVDERKRLEEVRQAAERGGGSPAIWMGRNGEMAIMAGLVDAARFYFGNDTGALHVAAALGRPVVGIFGGGTWPRFQPVAARAVTVVQPLPCFGCAWDCLFVDAPCVRSISIASVRQALEQILDPALAGHTVLEAEGLDPGARELIDTATPRLRFLRNDSADRLSQVMELTSHTGTLSARLESSDTDRDARQLQIDELKALLKTSEADRAARQLQVDELTALLKTSEADRNARQLQIDELKALLETSEADRAARQLQMTELTAWLKSSETDRNARQAQIDELSALLKISEADRAARLGHVEELTALLLTSEADRAARGKAVVSLTAHIAKLESDRETGDTDSHAEEQAGAVISDTRHSNTGNSHTGAAANGVESLP